MRYQRIYIEITNACNLNCAFCLETKRNSRFMSPFEFEHILKEISNYTDHIYLHVKGEPTLHPHLKEIMDLADTYNKKIHLVTNGTLLDALDFDLISHPALAQLSISLQSMLIQSKADHEKYKNRIENMIMRSEDKPFSLFLRLWNENNDEQLQWLKTIMGIDFSYTPQKNRIQIRKNLTLDFDKSFTWPSLDHTFVSDQGHCYGGLKMMAILADGSLTPCCLDTDGNMVLGNLFETPFSQLIQSTRYTTFLSNMHQNRLNEDLCRHCSYHLKHKNRL